MVRNYKSTIIRKKQIADAAARIIIKNGSEHITTKKIAQEVGISETAIYRHFKNKSELLTFFIEDIEKMLLAEIEIDNSGKPFTLKTLETTIQTHIKNIVRRKGVSFQVIAEIISLGSKKLNLQAYRVIERYTGRIEKILEQGSKYGIIRRDIDVRAAAVLFFGMMQGLVTTWALSRYSFNLEEAFNSNWKIYRQSVLN